MKNQAIKRREGRPLGRPTVRWPNSMVPNETMLLAQSLRLPYEPWGRFVERLVAAFSKKKEEGKNGL